MRAKEFTVKKRDPNWRDMEALRKSGAAGAHRDKKKEQKQGYEKHKNKGMAEGISVVDQDYDLDQVILTLDIEGKRASFTYTDYDENFENAERRDVFDQLQNNSWYKGLDHPTKMEILDAAYKAIRGEEPSEYKPRVDDEPLDIDEGWGNKEFEVDGYTYMTDVEDEEDNRKIWHTLVTPDGKEISIDWSPYSYMSKNDVELYIKLGMPKRQSAGPLDHADLVKLAHMKGVADLDPKLAKAESMYGRRRDPEDWDEGNTEPPNNFAVYINGKKWKVFKGRGTYADDAREKAHFQQLKAWAHKKSMDTGKEWKVYITGEGPTE